MSESCVHLSDAFCTRFVVQFSHNHTWLYSRSRGVRVWFNAQKHSLAFYLNEGEAEIVVVRVRSGEAGVKVVQFAKQHVVEQSVEFVVILRGLHTRAITFTHSRP